MPPGKALIFCTTIVPVDWSTDLMLKKSMAFLTAEFKVCTMIKSSSTMVEACTVNRFFQAASKKRVLNVVNADLSLTLRTTNTIFTEILNEFVNDFDTQFFIEAGGGGGKLDIFRRSVSKKYRKCQECQFWLFLI